MLTNNYITEPGVRRSPAPPSPRGFGKASTTAPETSGTVLNFVVGGTAYTGTHGVNPPTNPVATPGNGQVTLSWTGSSGATSSRCLSLHHQWIGLYPSCSRLTLPPATPIRRLPTAPRTTTSSQQSITVGRADTPRRSAPPPSGGGSSNATIVAQGNCAFVWQPCVRNIGCNRGGLGMSARRRTDRSPANRGPGWAPASAKPSRSACHQPHRFRAQRKRRRGNA